MYQTQNYSLEIISRSPDFNGKSLRKYAIEGIETVGAFGNEPFEIKFTNHTYQKVQVKISLDGTDILTGEQATSEPTGQMWVVDGKGTMTLKAWPETKNGGAAFVFTSADKSVAVHTHGDLSHRGIIAAAVFTEGHVEPIRPIPAVHHHHHHNNWWSTYPYYGDYTFGSNITCGGSYSKGSSSGALRSRSLTSDSTAVPASQTFYNSTSLNDASGGATGSTLDCSMSAGAASASNSIELQSLASVGAGSYTEQQITYTTGLIKPLLSATVRVKYVWWDDLVAALRTNSVAAPQPSGFPGDKPLMSIGSTPRSDTRAERDARRTKVLQELQFSRF